MFYAVNKRKFNKQTKHSHKLYSGYENAHKNSTFRYEPTSS